MKALKAMLQHKTKDKMKTKLMKDLPQKTKLRLQEEIVRRKNKLQHKTKNKTKTKLMKDLPQKPKNKAKFTFN